MNESRYLTQPEVISTLSDSAYRTDEPYLKAIDKITDRMNSNSGWFSSVSRNDVLKVVNRYTRRLEQNPSIPPYNTYYVETVPKPAYFQTATDVANSAGVEISLARSILTQLEYADKDGSIVKGILDPKQQPKAKPKTTTTSSSNNDPILRVPGDDELNTDPQGDNSDLLKWGSIGLAGGLIVLYLVKRKK